MESIWKTHPLILGAAASVMLVSLVGAAAITGILPVARSDKTEMPVQKSAVAPESVRQGADMLVQKNAVAQEGAHQGAGQPAARACSSCGTVEAIHAVQVKGAATGLGAVAGGLTGAVVGNQIGRGNGNTAMTILGAAGGAFAGNEIEKNVKKHYRYRVTVRMDDGSVRTVSQLRAPAAAVGERVRIVNGAIVIAHSRPAA